MSCMFKCIQKIIYIYICTYVLVEQLLLCFYCVHGRNGNWKAVLEGRSSWKLESMVNNRVSFSLTTSKKLPRPTKMPESQ